MTSQTTPSILAAATVFALLGLIAPGTGRAQTEADAAPGSCLLPPAISQPPLHGDGAPVTLHWPAHPSSKGHTLWAQWRVPEGPVVNTLERQLDRNTLSVTLPASPQPWRHLMLQVELTRLCQTDTGAPLRPSAPAQARQLQYSPEQACAPVEGLARTTAAPAPNSAPAPRYGLRWQGQPQETFEITWFDPSGQRVLARAEVQGTAAGWPASVLGSSLIRARRSCGEGRWSTPAYQRAP